MSLIHDVVQTNRKRILAEVEAHVWHDNPELQRLGRVSVARILGQILDAVVSRATKPESPVLVKLLSDLVGRRRIPVTVVLGALLRLGSAVRAVAIRDVTSKREVAIASAAIDRAIAETVEESKILTPTPETAVTPEATETDLHRKRRHRVPRFALKPHAQELQTATTITPSAEPGEPAVKWVVDSDEDGTIDDVAGPPRDPTMLQHIKDVLAEGGDEQNIATIVAVALRGLDTREKRTSAIGACRQAMQEANGEIAIDTPFLACCVLPPRLDRSDAQEGLRLALELARLPELENCGFGVVRGGVSTDESTTSGRILATAVGLATNAKDGVVLTDDEIHALTGETYALRPVTIEGSAYRVDPAQPQWLDRWEQASLVAEPSLIGRGEALKLLRSQLLSPTRKVAMVRLRGKTGAGKHRLLRTALFDLAVPDDRVVYGDPHPLTPAPYWPITTIVRRILGLADGPVAKRALRERLAQIAHASAATASLKGLGPTVEALLGADEPDGLVDMIEPETLRAEIAKTFRMLIEAVADQHPDRPFVIVVREVEKIDLPTLHALSHLANNYQGAAQLVMALCYRGTFRPPAALARVGDEELIVEPLADEDIVTMAQSMLDQEDVSMLDAIIERSHGLPMMADNIIRFLVEIGALHRRDGTWETVFPIRPSTVPRQMSEIIERRIEHLPKQLGSLLQSAAGVGEPLAWPILELIWVTRGIAHEELHRGVGLLVEMGFFTRDRDDRVHFSHPMIRQVAYRMQSEKQRREIHQLALVAYRERYPDALRQIPAVVFEHALAAGDQEAARAAAIHALRRALLLHDYKRGLQLAERALDLVGGGSGSSARTTFDLLAARERLFDAEGNRGGQKLDIKQMVSLAERANDDGRMGVALHRAARLNLLTGDVKRAGAVADKAVERLRSGDPIDLANALRTLALIRWHEKEPSRAGVALEAALSIYEKIGHRRGMGFVLHNIGLFSLDTGALKRARDSFERALEIKEETEDTHGKSVVLDALGQVALLEGNRTEAAQHLAAALSLRQVAGDDLGIANTEVNLGFAVLQDDATRAEQLARSALGRCRGKRHKTTRAEANILLARALLAMGQKEPASRAAKAATKLTANVGLLSVRALLTRAEIDLTYSSKQRLLRAAQAAQSSAEIAMQKGAIRWRIEALSLLAAARRRIGSDNCELPAKEAIALLDEHSAVGLDVERIRQRCDAVLRRV